MDRDKKCYEEWIDIAKGIAMLAIMYSHIRSGISDGGGGINYIDIWKRHLYQYSFSSQDFCTIRV